MPSIDQLTKLLKAEPNDAFLLYGLAQEYAKAGDVNKAVEFYDRCIGVDPKYAYAMYHKAKALMGAGRTEEAKVAIAAGYAAAKLAKDSHAHGELDALAAELD
jgi:predicted Zn-dependent protease